MAPFSPLGKVLSQNFLQRLRVCALVNPSALSAGDCAGAPTNQLKFHEFGRRQRTCFLRLRNQEENTMKPCAALALTLGVAVAPSMLRAQEAWPARPITLVVPYGAGGYTDLVARLTARYLEKALGKPVIVDNRAGAGGIV